MWEPKRPRSALSLNGQSGIQPLDHNLAMVNMILRKNITSQGPERYITCNRLSHFTIYSYLNRYRGINESKRYKNYNDVQP